MTGGADFFTKIKFTKIKFTKIKFTKIKFTKIKFTKIKFTKIKFTKIKIVEQFPERSKQQIGTVEQFRWLSLGSSGFHLGTLPSF